MKRIACSFLLAAVFIGCGSSKKRDTSLTEMKRVKAAFGDLQIALDAGVSKQEFSQRLNDTLVRIGSLPDSRKLAGNGFPKDTDKIALIYAHFTRAADAYKLAKEFFGDRWDYLLEDSTDFPSDSERQVVKASFPELVTSSGNITSRRDTLQSLWGLAGDETHSASEVIDQISQ